MATSRNQENHATQIQIASPQASGGNDTSFLRLTDFAATNALPDAFFAEGRSPRVVLRAPDFRDFFCIVIFSSSKYCPPRKQIFARGVPNVYGRRCASPLPKKKELLDSATPHRLNRPTKAVRPSEFNHPTVKFSSPRVAWHWFIPAGCTPVYTRQGARAPSSTQAVRFRTAWQAHPF
jgi:hypothetical protein